MVKEIRSHPVMILDVYGYVQGIEMIIWKWHIHVDEEMRNESWPTWYMASSKGVHHFVSIQQCPFQRPTVLFLLQKTCCRMASFPSSGMESDLQVWGQITLEREDDLPAGMWGAGPIWTDQRPFPSNTKWWSEILSERFHVSLKDLSHFKTFITCFRRDMVSQWGAPFSFICMALPL